MRTAVLSLLCCAASWSADFNPARWRERAALTGVEQQRKCVVTLGRSMYEGAQRGLGDLRVARDGQELPYVIESLEGSVGQTELRPSILDRSVVPGAGLELTLDLGRTARHNRLRISTAQKNFRIRVRIETSSDGRRWAVARDKGYVFDFTESGRSISSLAVDYPLATRRYVRATFFGWMHTDDVTGAWLTDYQERPAVWQALAVARPAVTEDGRSSLVTLDLGAAQVPHSRLRLETSAPLFHRACEIESSPDRKLWTYVGAGIVYRFPDEESLVLQFPEQWDRYARLRIFNGDDRPIPIRSAVFETIERRVEFLADGAGDYFLYWGNPQAGPPAYDLAAILARRGPAPGVELAAGSAEPNPAFVPPPGPVKPWSDRYPAVLYTVLAAAILGMGYVTARFLMKVKQADQSSK